MNAIETRRFSSAPVTAYESMSPVPGGRLSRDEIAKRAKMDIEDILKFKSGDVDGFTNIYERNWDQVFVFALNRTKNFHIAEDITQEIFTSVFLALDRYELTNVPPIAWIFTIAQNRIRDYYRGKARRPDTVFLAESKREDSEFKREYEDDEDGLGRADTEEIAEANIRLGIVFEGINRLTVKQRQAMLFLINGYSNTEISNEMGTEVGVVKSLIHRARVKLQKMQ